MVRLLSLQDVMFRESRRPIGDPEVLAAQSREQYYKVHACNGLHSSVNYITVLKSGDLSFPFKLYFFSSWRTSCSYSHWELGALEFFQHIFHILQKLQQGAQNFCINLFHNLSAFVCLNIWAYFFWMYYWSELSAEIVSCFTIFMFSHYSFF